jgi:uncharacterized protein DUF4386
MNLPLRKVAVAGLLAAPRVGLEPTTLRSTAGGSASPDLADSLTAPGTHAHDRPTNTRDSFAGHSLTTVGAACAIATVIAFAAGIVFMAVSGVQVLIPPTGEDGLDWIRDVDDAGGTFFLGAWLIILGGVLGIPALIGFYNALRRFRPWFILAPILSAVGLTLVTLSHLIPIAMAYELVPGYTAADAATKTSLATTADTFAVLALVVNYTGDVVLWGVVVPMYAIAVLKTSVVPRWIGWLGIGVGVFAGLGNALSPASSVIDGITFIGFVAFFVWIAAMGVALLRREREVAPPTSVTTPVA